MGFIQIFNVTTVDHIMRLYLLLLLGCIMISAVYADEVISLPGCPDVLVEGSTDIFANRKSGGRVGDRGRCSSVAIMGSSAVLFNGKPALRVGDQVLCMNGKIGFVRDGESSIVIDGKPLATAASRIVGCE